MDSDNALAGQFEAVTPHLRSVAFHLLGSVDDTDDAVQAAWLKAAAPTAGPSPPCWISSHPT